MGKKVSKKVTATAASNPCDLKPDDISQLPGGITLHSYDDVPLEDAAKLIFCRRKDPKYYDDDLATGSSADVCTVMIYYK
jgi:hypothetical protein